MYGNSLPRYSAAGHGCVKSSYLEVPHMPASWHLCIPVAASAIDVGTCHKPRHKLQCPSNLPCRLCFDRFYSVCCSRKGASGTAAVACLVLLLASGGLGWSLIVTRAQIKELHHTHEVTAQELSHARDALHRVEVTGEGIGSKSRVLYCCSVGSKACDIAVSSTVATVTMVSGVR